MVHDLLVTVGVYSLFGLQITPDTVIAILTILGYSLYDTVVVFDRVRDNAGGILKSGDLSYGEMVNLSMNQTLARSITPHSSRSCRSYRSSWWAPTSSCDHAPELRPRALRRSHEWGLLIDLSSRVRCSR